MKKIIDCIERSLTFTVFDYTILNLKMNFNLIWIITVCKTQENNYLINLYSFFF